MYELVKGPDPSQVPLCSSLILSWTWKETRGKGRGRRWKRTFRVNVTLVERKCDQKLITTYGHHRQHQQALHDEKSLKANLMVRIKAHGD